MTLPFCFSEYPWKQCQSKPANLVAGLLGDRGLQEGLIGTYGWCTLEYQQWHDFAKAVTGFIKLDSNITESILKLWGAKGVFFEPLAKHRVSTNISWIHQNKEEPDQGYLHRVLFHRITPVGSLTAAKVRVAWALEILVEACLPPVKNVKSLVFGKRAVSRPSGVQEQSHSGSKQMDGTISSCCHNHADNVVESLEPKMQPRLFVLPSKMSPVNTLPYPNSSMPSRNRVKQLEVLSNKPTCGLQ